jgi:NAD(P)-dependent dehydrogenase (short-subunit alcohol dehydrogenase family)
VGVVEVWDLDLKSYSSVKAFATKASTLDRLDVLVSNAGIVTYDFELAENNESTITVNVVSGMLLALLLLSKLRETSTKFEKETVITFTGSFVHFLTGFPEQKSEHILHDLAVREKARMDDR